MLATGGICARMNLMPVPKKGTLWRQLHLFHIIFLHTMSSHTFEIQIFSNQF